MLPEWVDLEQWITQCQSPKSLTNEETLSAGQTVSQESRRSGASETSPMRWSSGAATLMRMNWTLMLTLTLIFMALYSTSSQSPPPLHAFFFPTLSCFLLLAFFLLLYYILTFCILLFLFPLSPFSHALPTLLQFLLNATYNFKCSQETKHVRDNYSIQHL